MAAEDGVSEAPLALKPLSPRRLSLGFPETYAPPHSLAPVGSTCSTHKPYDPSLPSKPGRSASFVSRGQRLHVASSQRDLSIPAPMSTIQNKLFLGQSIGAQTPSSSAYRNDGSVSGWHSPPVPFPDPTVKSCVTQRLKTRNLPAMPNGVPGMPGIASGHDCSLRKHLVRSGTAPSEHKSAVLASREHTTVGQVLEPWPTHTHTHTHKQASKH